eukprot:Awhi_evm1s8444
MSYLDPDNNMSFSFQKNPFPKSSIGDAQNEEKKNWSVDQTLKYMDKTYSTQFGDWVHDERNLLLSTYHMRRLCKDYTTQEMAKGMLWIIEDWSYENASSLICGVCETLPAHQQGELVRLTTSSWNLVPHTINVIASLMRDMSPDMSAEFIISTCENWDPLIVTNTIINLSQQFSWSVSFKQLFVAEIYKILTLYEPSSSTQNEKEILITSAKAQYCFEIYKNIQIAFDY